MRIAVLDIGGTSIKSGIWDGSSLTCQREHDTNAKNGGEYVMKRVLEILHEYEPFDAVGISTAGQVDVEKGSIYYANDNIPGYTGMPVRDLVTREFGVPAAVENDVNAAALGELHFGAARGKKDFLCLTYGTGVGGAIVMDGKVYTGAAHSAGSFGGIVLHPEEMNEEEFSGCYEKYASATGLVKRAGEVDETLTNGRLIFANMERPEVLRVIDAWIDEVVYGLVSLIHIFNPSYIVLGGGVLAQPYVIGEVKERLKHRISSGFSGVQLAQAQLGNQAGMMGAVWMAEQILNDK